MDKAPDAFRTISEVAEWLETPAHVLRFWESRFSQIKPVKRAGGRRYYRPDDMALLGGIKHLLHDQGMTIRGVQKILSDQGVRHVAGLSGATPGATSDYAIDHVEAGKTRASVLQPGGATGGTPPDAQEKPTAQTPDPATRTAARRVSPVGKTGQETGSPVKADPVQAAQPEFSFTPPPRDTVTRDGGEGSAQNPPDTARPETSAPEAAAAFSGSAPVPAAAGSENPTAPDAAPTGETDDRSGTRDAPASAPDILEPKDAAKAASVATSAATTPVDQLSQPSLDDMSARALIASRLRAGGRIAPGDLSQARLLASRLAALQARMSGQRPGGSSHP